MFLCFLCFYVFMFFMFYSDKQYHRKIQKIRMRLVTTYLESKKLLLEGQVGQQLEKPKVNMQLQTLLLQTCSRIIARITVK
jgi:hypothetical protein